MADSRCIAVFGGSFNPPHIAHQLACLYVLETQPVDEVWLVPCYRHPFEKQLASFADRMEMCRLAMKPFAARVVVSDVEREVGGEVSRTLVTLQALAAKNPGASFRLVIGGDILVEAEKWWCWDEVARLAPPLVVGRAGYPAPGGGTTLVELPAVSSTDIRCRCARGQDISALVSRTVAHYIASQGLYA